MVDPIDRARQLMTITPLSPSPITASVRRRYLTGTVGLINCARVRRFRGWSAVAVTVASLSLALPFLMLLSGQSIDGTRAFRRDTGEGTETCQTL